MKILDRKLNVEKTKADYKKVAWVYDFWSWLTESKAAGKVLEIAEINNNQAILEVACGTGILLKKIIAKNPDGINIGIDISPDMLEKAREKMKKVKSGSYELKEGNALELDFKNETFDILINNFMVDLMPEDTFDIIISEFYRVLKPNGVAVISTFAFGKTRLHKFWYWVAKNMPDLLTGCRPVSIKENLENAGFIIESVLFISQNTFPAEIIRARK